MREFVAKTAERAVKTFLQFYFGYWLFLSGAAADFDHLFTQANVEAGIVGLALSVATSVGTKGLGPNPDSPSAI